MTLEINVDEVRWLDAAGYDGAWDGVALADDVADYVAAEVARAEHLTEAGATVQLVDPPREK